MGSSGTLLLFKKNIIDFFLKIQKYFYKLFTSLEIITTIIKLFFIQINFNGKNFKKIFHK